VTLKEKHLGPANDKMTGKATLSWWALFMAKDRGPRARLTLLARLRDEPGLSI
jgi:hypothetical protein